MGEMKFEVERQTEVISNQLTKTREIKEDTAVLNLKVERNGELINEQVLRETKKTRTEVKDAIMSQTKHINNNNFKNSHIS